METEKTQFELSFLMKHACYFKKKRRLANKVTQPLQYSINTRPTSALNVTRSIVLLLRYSTSEAHVRDKLLLQKQQTRTAVSYLALGPTNMTRARFADDQELEHLATGRVGPSKATIGPMFASNTEGLFYRQ